MNWSTKRLYNTLGVTDKVRLLERLDRSSMNEYVGVIIRSSSLSIANTCTSDIYPGTLWSVAVQKSQWLSELGIKDIRTEIKDATERELNEIRAELVEIRKAMV